MAFIAVTKTTCINVRLQRILFSTPPWEPRSEFFYAASCSQVSIQQHRYNAVSPGWSTFFSRWTSLRSCWCSCSIHHRPWSLAEVSLTLNFEKKDCCLFQKALGLLMQIIPNHYHPIMHTERKGRLSKWCGPLKVTQIKNVFTSSVLSQNTAKIVLKIHLQKQGDRREENCHQTRMPESGWQSCNWGRK